MLVYHASHRDFDKIDLKKAKSYRDFGEGFYVTEFMEDALAILKGKSGYLYTYELELKPTDIILELDDKHEWFEYVFKNRTEKFKDNYEIIIGATASGKCSKVFKGIRNLNATIDKEELLKLIYTKDFKEQICIKSEDYLNNLKLVSKEEY